MSDDYKYEPDPIVRRRQRRERLEKISERIQATLPAKLRFQKCDPPPEPEPIIALAERLANAASIIRTGCAAIKMVDDYPEVYEGWADRIIELMEESNLLLSQLGDDPRFHASPYGNLEPQARLLIQFAIKGMQPIEDSFSAHILRTAGREEGLTDAFWADLFKSADRIPNGSLSEELDYFAQKLRVSADAKPDADADADAAETYSVKEVTNARKVNGGTVTRWCNNDGENAGCFKDGRGEWRIPKNAEKLKEWPLRQSQTKKEPATLAQAVIWECICGRQKTSKTRPTECPCKRPAYSRKSMSA